MCAASASITAASHCPVVKPFTSASCLGGCCYSSGKCTSSSCAISGVGKEVPNTICYGVNAEGAIGGTPQCTGLACKLAVPGCTSDLLGGSCVGMVVDTTGTAFVDNPAGAALVGYPCLDVTPSDKTLNADGSKSTNGTGAYVASLWSVCDCYASAASAASAGADTTTPLPLIGKLDLANFTQLVSAVQTLSSASNPLMGALLLVTAQIPALVVPHLPTANLTSALSFLGSLVSGRKPAATASSATPLRAFIDLVRGTSAVAAAGNSTNPLGALLGALAPKSAGGAVNPLAGLANLVSALAPSGADAVERSDVLSGILGALSGGSAAAPQAELISAVAKLLGADSATAAGITTLLSGFKVPDNATDFVHDVTAAIKQGKEAASGAVGLTGIFTRLRDFVSGGTGSAATATTASPPSTNGIGSLLSAIGQLANLSGGGAPSSAALSPTNTTMMSAVTQLLGAALNPSSGTTGSTASTTSTTTSTVASDNSALEKILSVASKLAPTPASLGGSSSASTGDSNLLSSVLSAVAGGSGTDLSSLASLAGQVSPLLQALGGDGGTTGGSSAAASSPLGTILSALGTGGSTSGGGGGLSLANLGSLVTTVNKIAPVLQALAGGASSSGGDGSSGVSSVLSFLESLSS